MFVWRLLNCVCFVVFFSDSGVKMGMLNDLVVLCMGDFFKFILCLVGCGGWE